MAQRHEHLASAQRCLRDVLAHNRVAAGKSTFISQPLENPMRRVALLLVNRAIAFKDCVDRRLYGPSFFEAGRSRRR
jgi:hypothetical protein